MVTQVGNTGSGQPQQNTTKIIRRPFVKQTGEYEYEVTHFNGQRWVKDSVNTEDDSYTKMRVNIAKGFQESVFEGNGVITPEVAIKILLNSYQKPQRSSFNNEIKAVFDTCMSKYSDGGENITQKEQFTIMNFLFGED